MSLPDLLSLMRLLSALESWSFATSHRLPDHLLDQIQAHVELLEKEIIGHTK